MTIYIDDALIPATVGRLRSRWSHLMSDLPGADGTAELVAFAARLGQRRAWIQYEGTWKEHFDLTENKRWQAIRLGAVQIRYGHEGAALGRARRAGEHFDLDALRAAEPSADVPG